MKALPFDRNYSRGKAGPRFAALRSKILALLMRLKNRHKGCLELFLARKFISPTFKMAKRNVKGVNIFPAKICFWNISPNTQ